MTRRRPKPKPTSLPATLFEAEAMAFARAELAWFRDNPVFLFGIDVRMLDEGDNRRLARHALKLHALAHPLSTMKVADYARAGWDLADEALREAIIEFLGRGESMPTYLAAYNMERAAGGFRRLSGPKKGNKFLRNIALMMVVEAVGKQFGLNPTRSGKGPSACSVTAQAAGMGESDIVSIHQSLGRHI